MNALSVRGLTKTYKNGVQALKGIDLDVEQGDFFALLGPNGAGKTTLIGIAPSLVNKSAGTLGIFGHDIDRDLEAAKACVGVVPQEINFNMFESPQTILVNQAGFYGIERKVAPERAEKYQIGGGEGLRGRRAAGNQFQYVRVAADHPGEPGGFLRHRAQGRTRARREISDRRRRRPAWASCRRKSISICSSRRRPSW